MGNVFSILCFCDNTEPEISDEDSQSEGYENMGDAVEFYFSRPIYLQDEIEYIEPDGMLSCQESRSDV